MRRPQGFTLIELMIVAAIIGILAMVAVPKFANLIRKAREASVRGQLGQMRGILRIYNLNTGDQEPSAPGFGMPLYESNFVPEYIDRLPTITIPGYPRHSGRAIGNDAAMNNPCEYCLSDFGAVWMYDRQSSRNIRITVNCEHTDLNGRIWANY